MEADIDNLKIVENWAVRDMLWRESARGVMTDGWEIAEVTDLLATNLVNQVINGRIDLEELRSGVVWASALDAEATQRQSAILDVGDYRFERTARRIMHHAGRTALEQVKTRHKRTILSVGYRKMNLIEVE